MKYGEKIIAAQGLKVFSEQYIPEDFRDNVESIPFNILNGKNKIFPLLDNIKELNEKNAFSLVNGLTINNSKESNLKEIKEKINFNTNQEEERNLILSVNKRKQNVP